MIAPGWHPLERPRLRGFFDLTSPSGITINGLALLERDGRRWIGLPGRPILDPEGRHKVDPETGKRAWCPVVEIKNGEVRRRFTAAALAAVDALLGGAP
jgi:hypothetical protein